MCRILIVDDLEDDILWLKTGLEQQGFLVQTATGGWTALDIVEAWHPDIVLLDIILRDMLGYSVTKRIREDSALAHTRIILITASSILEEAEGIAAGADAFIRKPVDFAQLLFLVRKFCPVSRDRQAENLPLVS